MNTHVYVVATSQKEALELSKLSGLCHNSKAEAVKHLAAVKAPPTDSYYANQYRVYTVTKHTGSRVPSNTIPAATKPGDAAK